MTAQTLQLAREPLALRSKAFHLVCFGLLVANVAYVIGAAISHDWIVDAAGRAIHTDFTSVYAAGRLVLAGHPAAAYDWAQHYAAENAVSAHTPETYLGWHYPPPFLMIAGLLAALPYATAFLIWIVSTLALYLVTIRAIVGDRIGWLLGGAFPCLMPNVISGQNGFLTASLVGGALVLLEAQPVLAGCCLGLLSYKPQFGILFPLVLAAGGHWKAIGAAAATALALALLTVVLFGVTPWSEFLHWLPLTSKALFAQDHTLWPQDEPAWNRFQSLFALVRLLGGNVTLAWTLQSALAIVVAVALCAMWRARQIAFALKAAATAAGIVLVTPYVYLYDLTVLAVSMAFLVRFALLRGFARGEVAGLALLTAMFLILPFAGVPIGLPASAIIAVLIIRRVVSGAQPVTALAS
jgi:hypothetical protein